MLDVAVMPASRIALGMLHSSRNLRAAPDAQTMKRLALASVPRDECCPAELRTQEEVSCRLILDFIGEVGE